MKYLEAQMLEFSQRGDERDHLVVVACQSENGICFLSGC